MVGQHADKHTHQRHVMLDTSVLLVGILLRVLICGIRVYLIRKLLCYQLSNPVLVLPLDVAELVVERLEDV